MQLKTFVQRIFIALPLLLSSFLAFSQTENCTNGIDDDGDGLIDCFDSECTCTTPCEDFYYTTCNADCFYVPPCGQITLGVQWSSEAETGTYSPLVAGDMDADGIPDVVTTKTESPDLYIIDGATGATKVHIMAPTVWPGGTAPAIADLDHDGFGEIVIVGFDQLLYCYEHDGNLKYTSAIQVGYSSRYRYSVPNIADFDHDGWAEVNIGNQVFNGQTGALLAEGGPLVSAGEHPARVISGFSFASPVAIDALPDSFCADCDGLEIVAGNQVLSVNLITGAVVPVVTANAPMTDGFTSVADFDKDGDLDAIVQGRNSTNNFNTCFVWDIQTPTIIRQFQLFNNWQEGASRVNVADLNGDGQLELSFVSFPRLYALRNNFSVMWTRPVNDASSITCSSIFDFCGDGSADIVYRDQDFLRVINGATGAVSFQDNCFSATHIEAPLILDVDNDGQTEIVIECGANSSGVNDMGRVVAYEAIGTPGIASRKVWNQHAYFNTNINDDLSVPQYQQNPNVVGDSLVLNTFLNQYFNPTFPSPDGALAFQSVFCDQDSLEITLQICNPGDNILPPQTPVSVYMGNPQTSAAQWLGAVPIAMDILTGDCKIFTFSIPRVANDTIFLVLNDDHSIPTPFNLATDFPVTSIGECLFSNNIASFYFPYMPAVIDLGVDTAICDHTTISFDASGNDLVSWQWTGGVTTPDFTIQTPGQYEVSVLDVCSNVQQDTIIVSIDSSTVVNIGADQSLCKGETVSFSESGFDYYTWTSTASLDCTTCADVTVIASNSAPLVLVAGFDNGCVNRDSAFITVYDTFNYVRDTMICYGRKVTWNGLVIPPDSSATFYMQTVHGCDSTLLVRVIGESLGNFMVDTSVCLGSTLNYLDSLLNWGDEKVFNLHTAEGCDSMVLVRVAPRDTFRFEVPETLCFGDSINLFGTYRYVSGDYQNTYTAKNGCDSTRVVHLQVYPQIELEIDATNACFGEANGSLSATVTNGVEPLDFSWNFSGSHSAILDDLPAGDYTLTVTDGNDCTETESITLESHPGFTFSVSEDSVSCYGLSDGSILIESPDPSLTYSLDGGPFVQSVLFDHLSAANYEVIAEDVYGCQDTLAASVLQPPLLSVKLPADTTIQLGVSLPLQIGLTGLAPLNWVWSDTTYLSCIDCPDPVVQTPLQSIRYQLTIVDENGCVASDEILLTVDQVVGVYIPNAIGGTGDNSRFDINFGPAVRKVNLLRVFDRWGSLLHEVQNVLPGDATISWDGRHKGSFVNPGVYIWVIELELVDGKVVKKKGDLTVVR